jgi:hypothetical protein
LGGVTQKIAVVSRHPEGVLGKEEYRMIADIFALIFA